MDTNSIDRGDVVAHTIPRRRRQLPRTMNELEKLIAEFKATLSKFEAIASRMEARIAQDDPVDPIADLPPLPPIPEGYSRWEYRGLGWKPYKRVRFASLGCLDTDWVTFPFGCTVGYANSYYIEAVKDHS